MSEWPQDDTEDTAQMNYFKGIIDGIKNTDPNPTMLKTFKHFLDQLDQRRNTNWREIYPYLDI